jgi:hypothetical protein
MLEAHPEALNARNESGDTLLLAAAYSGRREIFDLLIARGAGVNLYEAAAVGLADRVAAHLDGDPGSVNSYSHDGWTPLHLPPSSAILRSPGRFDRGADITWSAAPFRAREHCAACRAANRQGRRASWAWRRRQRSRRHGYTAGAGAAARAISKICAERGAVV